MHMCTRGGYTCAILKGGHKFGLSVARSRGESKDSLTTFWKGCTADKVHLSAHTWVLIATNCICTNLSRKIDLDDLPTLGFDHGEIIKAASNELMFKSKYQPLGFELLPEKFTLSQLQKLYEAILGTKLDKRNFRRKFEKIDLLTPLDEKEQGVAHKPAQFFTFNNEKYDAYRQHVKDFYFTL